MIIKKFLTTKNIVFLVLAILLLLLIPKITGILLLFFAAYVIACALNPYVNQISKNMKRPLAVLSVLLVCFLAIVAIFIPVFVIGINEIKLLVTTLPDKILIAINFLQSATIFGNRLVDLVNFDEFDISSFIGTSSNLAQNILSQSMNFTVGLIQFLVVLVAIGMIVFYILSDKEYMKSKFLELFPPDLKEKAKDILSSISGKVGGYVRAQILSMVAIGVMVSVALLILGVEYPLFLGLVSGLLDIIPILGPTIALILILVAAYQLGIVKIILIIVIFLIIQQLSNYLIRPLLFGKFMSLHPLTIFLALFLAEQFLGFWGIIMSPAIAATVCVLIDELYITPINNGLKE